MMKSALIFSIFGLLVAFVAAKAINEDLKDPRSWFYDHDTVKPVIYSAEKGKRDVHSNSAHAEDELVLELEAFDKKFELSLHMNKALLPDKYFEEQEGEDGEMKVVYPIKDGDAKHCHYKGLLNGNPGSWAAISMCDGISGAFFDGKELYYVEPNHVEEGENHFVFKASDTKSFGMKCGISDDHIADYIDPPSGDYIDPPSGDYIDPPSGDYIDPPSGDYIDPPSGDFEEEINPKTFNEISTTQYVELGYVVDKTMYDKYQTTTKTNDRCKAVANLVNTLYTSLNVSVSLVGIKIWSSADAVTLGDTTSAALGSFATYRTSTLVNEYSHDVAQLFSGKDYQAGSKGIAYIGTMCGTYSCGLIKDFSPVLGQVGATSAHEMGHNFGMKHDFSLTNCTCSTPPCLMDYSNQVRSGWSSCSVSAIDTKVNSGTLTCLSNVPTTTVP